MRNVVINDIGHEFDFKPLELINEYISKTEDDFREETALNPESLNIRACPACNSKDFENTFSKFGFDYTECKNCRSVFLNPCPEDELIKQHYLNSDSSHFWQEKLANRTKETRVRKIYRPEHEWIVSTCEEYIPKDRKLGLFYPKSYIFADCLAKEQFFSEKYLINPYFSIPRYGDERMNGQAFSSIEEFAATGKKINIAGAFEALDSLNNIDSFFSALNGILEDGGLVFLTTISISGFDLQVLRGSSRNIFPPDRVNALSRKGMNILFERHGFKPVEYSTPGILDFNNVEQEYRSVPDADIPGFIREMIEKNDEQMKRDFQNFLQINKLSSFVRVVLEKKE
ncbi:MAG: hypothetical protein JW931_02650 [Methanomicrobiaceae archaeon]|nr:hypothetical protein [Methanomicrobiaceae archaeon]